MQYTMYSNYYTFRLPNLDAVKWVKWALKSVNSHLNELLFHPWTSSSFNSKNVVLYVAPGNELSLRINPPMTINDKFYLGKRVGGKTLGVVPTEHELIHKHKSGFFWKWRKLHDIISHTITTKLKYSLNQSIICNNLGIAWAWR